MTALNQAVIRVARVPYVLRAANIALAIASRVRPGNEQRCPLCEFEGHFAPILAPTGVRRLSRCPRCGSAERHRIQAEALKQVIAHLADRPNVDVLHIAPEASLAQPLKDVASAGSYTSGDIDPHGVDVQVDLRSMPQLGDESFDLLWASHVLEHIDDDASALREIKRVLKPDGIAVLPVPIVADRTVEYSTPCAAEHGHVRAPGLDYLDRYRAVFSMVETVDSSEVDQEIQPWIYEDRAVFPTDQMPERPAQSGARHADVVPICYR